jgi:predicted porin
MKNVLLAGTALVATALIASPAQAELKLDLGGHFSGYAVNIDDDAVVGGRDNEIRKNTEIHFTGETTLDNGLTVGVHVEQEVENANNNNESYAYFSGGWGRVNFGSEDGVAYLLQVAAPSADSNVDGLRTTIAGYTTNNVVLDYDHAHFGGNPTDDLNATPTDRISYLTPKFNGFQAGVSYAPNIAQNTGIAAVGTTGFEDAWELAVRWDGEFEGVGISVGGGYSSVDNAAAGAVAEPEAWNVGFNLAWNQFSFGGAWLDEEDAFFGGAPVVGQDATTWVIGAAWDNGPYHVGASYLDREDDLAGVSVDSTKATIGGGYTFGPGMTFRGAVAWGEAPTGGVVAGSETDFTQITLGTDIQF